MATSDFEIYRITKKEWIVDITESNVAAGDYVEIQPQPNHRFPLAGEVVRVDSRLASGDASTIQPELSGATSFVVPYLIIKTDPDDEVSEVHSNGVPYGLVGEKFYHRSNPSAGTNNSIVTRYLIRRKWEE